MFLTIEEMNELKETYLAEMSALQAKVAVVNDLIAMAESKVSVKSDEAVEEVQAETAETVETANY